LKRRHGHPGYEKNSSIAGGGGDKRNGHTEKTAPLENQSTSIEALGGRSGTFEPIIIPEHEKLLPLFNGRIISMYPFGMAGRDIKSRLEKIYNVEAPPGLMNRAADAVLEDVPPPAAARTEEPSAGKTIRYSALGRIARLT
jgi:putative transposase